MKTTMPTTEKIAELERRIERLEDALRALSNPHGIVRSGDASATRIPPHEFARAVLKDVS